MDRNIVEQADLNEDILTFDLPDDVLERTAGTGDARALTWMYCTHVWYNCGWPQ
jgi:hypothetical protein